MKVLSLFMIICLFICGGCSQTTGEQTRPMAYGYPMVNLPGEEEGRYDPDETVLMKSYSEYQKFLERMMKETISHDLFFSKLSSYDKTYFQQNMLVFIGFEGMGTDYEFELNHFEVKDNTIQIDLRRWVEGASGDAITYYGIIIELPKTQTADGVEYSLTKERPSATRSGRNDKVLVAGVGDVLHCSYEEIAEKLNDAGNNAVTMKMIFRNSYKVTYHTPSALSNSEIKKIAEQYRKQVTDYFTAKNQEIIDAQDWTGLDLTFRIDSYMPWVYVDFPSGISKEQVELLHDLMRGNQQIRMLILSPQK